MLPLLALRIDIRECHDCSFSLKTFLKRRTILNQMLTTV